MSSDSREKLSGLTPDMLEVGELALITENNYERLYCKNNDGEVVPIHRIFDAGEIEIPKQDYLVYTTTGASQSVKLINMQEYAKKITLEDGTDVPITGSGLLNYTFADAGEHKVAIELKEDVTDFSQCFDNCSGLTSIPDNLFASNTAVTTFMNCFAYCSGLTGIPENLFVNNTAVTNFDSCFFDCSGLTGNCPVDNDGTPIYNRSGEGKEGYAIVTDSGWCFNNCRGLTDYSSIPRSWGGGGA